MNRWARAGVLDQVFEQLQHCRVVRISIGVVSLDSTSIKVHPDGTGAQERFHASSGTCKFFASSRHVIGYRLLLYDAGSYIKPV